MLEKVHC